MAFPRTALATTVELAPGADLTAVPSSWSWTDYTTRVFNGDRISITHGRTDRYTVAPPARLALTFLNDDGLFVPSNPRSALYGLIDVNTPIRVSIRPDTNSASDTFTRTVSSSWGSADTGGTWTSTGGAASDFAVSATFARITNTAATAPHYSTLAASMLRSDITVRVRVNALSTGAAQTVACVSRYASASAANRVELRFNTDQTMAVRLVGRVAGVDTAQTAITVPFTHAAATWYRFRVQIGLSTVRAKVWLDGTTEPATWSVDGSQTLTSNTTAGQCGLYAMRETGNTNANATMDFDDLVLVDGPRIRTTNFVDEWPTTWADGSGLHSYAPITASGNLRRVQSEPTLRSALYRAHTIDYGHDTPDVVGYWPMEDKSSSRTFASAVGGPPMLFSGFTPASDTSFAGSEALPTAGSGGGQFSGAVRTYTSPSPNVWSVRCAAKFPNVASANTVVMQWNTSGGNMWRWQFVIITGVPDTFKLQAFDSAGAEKLGAASVQFANTLGAELYGNHLYLRADASQNGANIDWVYSLAFVDSNGQATTKLGSGSVAGVLGNASRIYSPFLSAFSAGGYAFGHVGVGKAIGWGPADTDAVSGYAGESTVTRFIRLCQEQNFSPLFGDYVVGLGGTDQKMGAQTTTSFIDQLRQVEATEEGVLLDGAQGHLQLLPRKLRRNHSVDLVLDIAAGDLGWPYSPTYDTFLLRNDVTATTPAGSSVRLVGEGANAPAKIGTFPDTVTVNAPDADLDSHASFRLAAGVIREGRLPQITLNFNSSPHLVESWLNTDVGSRLTVAHPLSQMDPTPLDAIVEGWTELIDSLTWTAAVNCSPSTVWKSFTLEAAGNQGRLDTHGTTLMAAYTGSDTTVRVATAKSPYNLSNTPRWSTSTVPYDWNIAGEQLTVTAMGNNTPAFINAGTAAHGNNASLTASLPASIQKGDEVLVLAAIRNTAAAPVLTGWTVLADGGNVVLYGRPWDGVFTAPTVSFTGGAAGDTTSVQSAAFRYLQNTQSGPVPVAQTNGSAQNIATPVVESQRFRCLAIAIGWKQNSWTSVAPLGSWTEIGDTSSALGSTQGIVWDYQLMSGTTTLLPADTFVVTGGVNAISKGLVVALAADVQEATVTRHVNGVTKAQASGASVALWKPGRVAL